MTNICDEPYCPRGRMGHERLEDCPECAGKSRAVADEKRVVEIREAANECIRIWQLGDYSHSAAAKAAIQRLAVALGDVESNVARCPKCGARVESVGNPCPERCADDAPVVSRPTAPREPMQHKVKCWPGPFAALIAGEKVHEIRRFDRDYRKGDTFTAQEYDPFSKQFSGREFRALIGHVTPPGEWGMPAEFGVLSLVHRLPVDVTPKMDVPRETLVKLLKAGLHYIEMEMAPGPAKTDFVQRAYAAIANEQPKERKHG